ncbi:alpha-L-fucosidase [uncultured Duncaniella sp.]|uniref:alpha-L-fucosidase n=2 Tax=uncultured Duncaniella sp. TaxID=2768039 RepID=UPI00350F734C|nr:alpha-L-fucosidase [Muribaculaceae bacterium]
MKSNIRRYAAMALLSVAGMCASLPATAAYVPTDECMKAREEFSDARFGVFIHWGIYSMFGQGEWYLNYGADRDEYAKAAKGFYPASFDAKEWVSAIKDAGAKYITITSRHHDGFSMWHTAQSPYNIVDGTPWGRDVIKELAEECQKQGIKLHLYYSHIDWTRDDYPMGRTGRTTGKDPKKADWKGYYKFMNNQLTELLTNYGPIGAIWFDGKWDRDEDPVPFDWELDEQYAMIHRLQPGCLVGNNHHETPIEGEDIQIFERDLPGENSYGLSGQSIGQLPLETCATMNGMWGYKIMDQDYKSLPTLIQLLVGAAGKGANLLLNVGPQPSGEIPATALSRLKEMGEWLRVNGETIYGTERGDFPPQSWGTSTRKGDKLYVHLLTPESKVIHVPTPHKVKKAVEFATGKSVKFRHENGGVTLLLDELPTGPDHIITLEQSI